jgi:hypothetical protein
VSEFGEVNAVWARVVGTAQDILHDRRAPYEAARELWRLRNEVAQIEEALRPFVGLASEWEDTPDHRSDYEQDIRLAAESVRRKFGP